MADEEVERMKELSKDIWLKATQHGNRYVLPRRFKEGDDPEKDKLYDACGYLVIEGCARWIDRGSSMWPGIELNGPTLDSFPPWNGQDDD
jgi:hypothetical protein